MAHLSEDAGADRGVRLRRTTSTLSSRRGCSASPPEQVDAGAAQPIKAMNYGLAYGLSAYGLSQQLRVSPDEARGAHGRVLRAVRRSPRLPASRSSSRPAKDGYTETILGRRRYLPDLTSDNRQRREMAERMALNAPIQGSAADIIKVAMLAVPA